MIVKVHKTLDGRKIIAICDSDLIGKKARRNMEKDDLFLESEQQVYSQ